MNKVSHATNIQKIYKEIAKGLNPFDLEIRGLENIVDTPCIFMCNHSNSHDFYTVQQVFGKLDRRVSVLAGSDCLNGVSRFLFQLGSSVLVDRNSFEERKNSKVSMMDKIQSGSDVFVFCEGTWNLHPYHLMLPISKGGIDVAYLTGCYVVPVVFEYVENKGFYSKESDLYKKCVIQFGTPFKVTNKDLIIDNTVMLKNTLNELRYGLKNENGVFYACLEDVLPEEYLNHTYLKKNTPLFKLDSDYEAKFIRWENHLPVDNEYALDESGLFVPKRILKR